MHVHICAQGLTQVITFAQFVGMAQEYVEHSVSTAPFFALVKAVKTNDVTLLINHLVFSLNGTANIPPLSFSILPFKHRLGHSESCCTRLGLVRKCAVSH